MRAAPGPPDWERNFGGYASTVEYPGCSFWGELVQRNPTAKVLRCVRDVMVELFWRHSFWDGIRRTRTAARHSHHDAPTVEEEREVIGRGLNPRADVGLSAVL